MRRSLRPRRWPLGVLLLACLTGALGGATGCASRRAAAGPVALVEPDDARRLGFLPAWSRDLAVPRGERLTQVEVLDDLVVTVESPSNLVTAVSARDGHVVWQQVVGERFVRLFNPLRVGPHVFVSSENAIYTLSADTGALVVYSRLPSPVDTGPALAGNYAVFGGSNGRAFALDLTAGASRWNYEMSAGIRVRPTPAPPNHVVLADSRGIYALVNAQTGDPVWRGRTFGTISARPAVTSAAVFVASEDQALYSLNRATGRDRWAGGPFRSPVPLSEDPVVLGSSLYLPIPGRELVSIDPDTGKPLWRLPGRPQPVMLVGDRLLVNSGRVLGLVDNKTGQPAVAGVRTRPLQRALPGPAGSLLLVSADGRLERFDPLR